MLTRVLYYSFALSITTGSQRSDNKLLTLHHSLQNGLPLARRLECDLVVTTNTGHNVCDCQFPEHQCNRRSLSRNDLSRDCCNQSSNRASKKVFDNVHRCILHYPRCFLSGNGWSECWGSQGVSLESDRNNRGETPFSDRSYLLFGWSNLNRCH